MATAAPVKKSILALLSLLLTLTAAEMLARVIYVEPWYLGLGDEKDLRALKAKLGPDIFEPRDPHRFGPKSTGTKRILVLGDSFTWGFGVEDSSKVFSSLIETKLNAELLPQNEMAEVFNGGLNASLTDRWVELLDRTKDSFQPDAILIVFFLRDGTKITSKESFFDPIRKEVKSKDRSSFLYKHFYLFRFFQERFQRLHLSKKYSQALREAYEGGPEKTAEWENAKKNILKIKEAGEGIHAKVGLVVFPVLIELNRNYPFKNVYERVMRFGNGSKIPTHGLLPAFMGRNAPELWVALNDQHPNEKGHEIAAESIFPFLKQLLVSSDRS